MISIVLLLLFSLSTALFNTDFQLEANVPITAALPSASPPWLLTSQTPLTLSLAPCPLSQSPTSIVSKPFAFSVLIDEKQLSQLTARGQCRNLTKTGVYATVVSPLAGKAAVEMVPVEKRQNNTAPIDVDGSAYFALEKHGYATFHFQLHSIERGLHLNLGLSHGSAEIFVSFCVDLEGVSLGKIQFPSLFRLFLSASRLVELMESHSCDSGALYHNLDKSPPSVIIRILSSKAEGGIVVTAGEVHNLGSRLQRSAADGKEVKLETNDTLTFDFSPAKDVTFTIVSGSVELSAVMCTDETEQSLGTYLVGNHTVPASNLSSKNCNVSMSLVTLTWSALETTTLLVDVPVEDERKSTKGMPWYAVAAILVLCSITVLFLCCIVYSLSKMREEAVESRKAKEETMQNIPMDSHWM